MNQLREWDGHCQRCYNKTDIYTMSMFDVALVCTSCLNSEKNHPNYIKACKAEEEAVKSGNMNFKGIGFRKHESG